MNFVEVNEAKAGLKAADRRQRLSARGRRRYLLTALVRVNFKHWANGRDSCSKRNKQEGHTLFELLVVLAVLALTAATAAPAFHGVDTSLKGKAAADSIAGELKLARSRAISSNQDTILNIDIDGNRYRIGVATDWAQIDAKLSLAFASASPSVGETASIIYYPDGSSSGGEVVVATKNRTWLVKAALNGKVSVDEKR